MTDKWLRPDEVIELIKLRRPAWSGFGSHQERNLLPFLQAGEIRAKAGAATYRKNGREEKARDWEIDPRFWEDVDATTMFLTMDHVAISYIGYVSPHVRIENAVCLSIIYSEEDVLRVVGPSKEALTQNETATPMEVGGPRGRPPKKRDWENFAAALAVVAVLDEEGIEPTASAASIFDRVAQVLQARLPADAQYMSYDSVRSTITLAQEWIGRGRIKD